jgi:hypothetical protein
VTEQPLDEYFAALERLKKGRPTVVSKGVKITNDAVGLEAGRGKGSIKKSRPVFADLIHAIDAAAAAQARPKNEQHERINKAKVAANQCRRELEASMAREISLLHELYETKQKLFRLTGETVLPLRGKTAK